MASDADGEFRAELPAGDYVMRPFVAGPNSLPFADEQAVTVEPAAFTDVTVLYDTGIR